MSIATEKAPITIRQCIREYWRKHGAQPRYILLGRQEHGELRMNAPLNDWVLRENGEWFAGIEVLVVNRESFLEVVA